MSKKCLRCDSILLEGVEYLCDNCTIAMKGGQSSPPTLTRFAFTPTSLQGREQRTAVLINQMSYGTSIRRNTTSGNYEIVSGQELSLSSTGVTEFYEQPSNQSN